MTLPFKLPKYHKTNTKISWRSIGIIFTDEDFELYIYPKYIYATHCDLCNKQFKSSKDRQLDHNHDTGEIRNILCTSCNYRKSDRKIHKNNTSGYVGITKINDKTCKQGFIWRFRIQDKTIKKSIDLDYLIKFRDNWLKENNYET